ncbi:hypothetical protein BDV97DRAFT_368353 [Delphinella strobiligena]|nr:hypothetical protein BDV97DRAFT_368353 [Delphinella strobiligena]
MSDRNNRASSRRDNASNCPQRSSARLNPSTNGRRERSSRSRSPRRSNTSNSNNRRRSSERPRPSDGNGQQSNPALSNTSNSRFSRLNPAPSGTIDLTGDDSDTLLPMSELRHSPDPASIAPLDRFKNDVQKIYGDLNLGPVKASISNFLPIPKLTVDVKGNKYSVYPDYSTDDLIPVQIPGDRADIEDKTHDPRFWSGPKWSKYSCVLDTFLWVSTVCNIRRLRNDLPAAICPEAQGKLSPLAQAVTQYLHLPLGHLHQHTIFRMKNTILNIIRRDTRIAFTEKVGMPFDDLFDCALGTSEGALFHQFGWTWARYNGCRGCSEYSISEVSDETYLGLNPLNDDPTPEHRLQAYIDRREITVTGPCSGCGGQKIRQWVVLDRLPDMLLWRTSMNKRGKWVEHVLRPVTLLVDAAEEKDLEDDGPLVWCPGRMQVTYKPVVVGIQKTYKVPTRGGTFRDSDHVYAASCLPFKDEEGRWLVYDGMRGIFDKSVPQEVIVENSEAELLRDIRRGNYGIDFAIMKKQKEVQIDWEERYVETVGPTIPMDSRPTDYSHLYDLL